MSASLTFASPGTPVRRTRFIFVNGRIPYAGEGCALCGGKIEEGYVRDLGTLRLYCDTQCFAGHTIWRWWPSKNFRGEAHEMRES
jgi:hypothetical protein